jgi:hypothetical protein
MSLSKDYFIQLQEMYQANIDTTEKVRLGDVMFQIESSKISLEQLIERVTEDLIQFKNNNNDNMIDYCQSKIDAYNICIDMFDKLYSNIKRKSL